MTFAKNYATQNLWKAQMFFFNKMCVEDKDATTLFLI